MCKINLFLISIFTNVKNVYSFLILFYICRFDEIKLPYQYLYEATNGFSESCLIGAGGFGKVFKSRLNLKQNNQIVAIKRMEHVFDKKDFKQYLNEICIVLKFKHYNLLPLLAISYDKQPCFIYEFMENGSLLDCISCNVSY